MVESGVPYISNGGQQVTRERFRETILKNYFPHSFSVTKMKAFNALKKMPNMSMMEYATNLSP